MSDEAYDLNNQGYQLSNQGNYQAAIGCYTQAADLARRSGKTQTELNALSGIAVCWANLGEYNKMAETATHLLSRARQLNNQKYEMLAGMRLATALANIDLPSRWPEIRQVLLAGLESARHLGDDYFVVYHLSKLGEYAQRVGESEAAYAWLQDALNAITPSTDRAAYFQYVVNLSLSDLARNREERGEALRYAEIALGNARKCGNPDIVADAQYNLAGIHRWRGEAAEALPRVQEALATSRRLQIEYMIVECLALKVQLLVDLGLSEEAASAYQELWAIEPQAIDSHKDIGMAAYAAMRDLDGAERAYRRFLEGRRNHPDGHCKLALVLYEQGRTAEALRSWRAALNQRNEFPEALAGLALGLWSNGERAEALTVLAQAAALQPRVTDPEYLAEKFDWSRQAVAATRPLISMYTVADATQRTSGVNA